MREIKIREILPDDAEQMRMYLKQIGGESDNLTFGKEGLPITPSSEREFLKNVHEDPHSVSLGAFAGDWLIGNGSLSGMTGRMGRRAEPGVSVRKAY